MLDLSFDNALSFIACVVLRPSRFSISSAIPMVRVDCAARAPRLPEIHPCGGRLRPVRACAWQRRLDGFAMHDFGFQRLSFLLQGCNCAKTLVRIGKIDIAFAWDHKRVTLANAVERGRVTVLSEAVERIGAKQGKAVYLAQFVPELLQANRRFASAVGPEQGDHLAEGVHLSMVRGQLCDHLADGLVEEVWIGPAVYHELGQRIGGIEHDVPAAFRGLNQIDSGSAQPSLHCLAMLCGGDHDGGLLFGQCGCDVIADRVHEEFVGFIELNEVVLLTDQRPIERRRM